MRQLFTILTLLVTYPLLVAQSEIENLIQESKKENIHDTSRVEIFYDISEFYRYSDINQSRIYANKAINLADKIKHAKSQFISRNNFANFYLSIGEYDSCQLFLEEALKIGEINKLSLLSTYNIYGNLYFYKSDYEKALEKYYEVLEITKSENDSSAMSKAYGNIGNVYYYLGDLKQVKTNFNNSLQIKLALSDSNGIAHTMGNMGNLYYDEGNYDSALYFFETSLGISDRSGNLYNASLCLSSIAQVYLNLENLKEAEKYLNKSIEYSNALGDKHSQMMSLYLLAPLQFKQGKSDLAVQTFVDGIKMAEELGAKEYIADGYLKLSEIEEKQNDFRNALGHYKLYHSWSDSILNDKKNESLALLQTEFKTKEIEDSLNLSRQNEEIATLKKLEAEQSSSRKTYLLVGVVIVLIVLIVLIFLVLKNYREKLKINAELASKNEEIIIQKEIIETKHAEITDSINYAKRIQTAILPRIDNLEKSFKEFFILYKPKDIVAGDFYWFEEINDVRLIAAADCTGHGVPGAMVSVVCNNALNRSVREFGIDNPGKILDQTRNLVVDEFKKSAEGVKDGMDISLICLPKNKNTIMWSGANNPLWIVRNETGDLEEIKADKQPIGLHSNPSPFKSHEIKVNSGDCLYIFTDGFQDQFGGLKGKKFKASTMKQLLKDNASKPLKEQQKILENAFDLWKGNLEQVDDICIIGIRV